MNNSNEDIKIDEKKRPKDRVLGDVWVNWKGIVADDVISAFEKKRKFILIAFSLLIFATLLAAFLLYMIYPRLLQFQLAQIVSWALIIIGIFFYLTFFAFILSLFLNVNLLTNKYFLRKILFILHNKVQWMGKYFGISSDRIRNAFVKINNLTIQIGFKKKSLEKIVVLLPRCLRGDIRKKTTEICSQFGCPVYVLSGGEAARKIIQNEKPSGIIGVACERDLTSGIMDVGVKIPCFGIANERPEGPCKNTIINLDEFNNALHYLLKNPSKS